MRSQKDGGPAFPVMFPDRDDALCQSRGLSLRDYFAAASLVFQSTPEAQAAISRTAVAACASMEEVAASAAYTLADAMLREREK